ncbi:hypothetical protein ACIHEJ_23485 [Streptomyces sp. NPDC052301]|uniref:hypothetical protein n=1 Tax=Streptomyces sp. NPDC052301 TaxID=3365687 RepID=UPI0037D70276
MGDHRVQLLLQSLGIDLQNGRFHLADATDVTQNCRLDREERGQNDDNRCGWPGDGLGDLSTISKQHAPTLNAADADLVRLSASTR